MDRFHVFSFPPQVVTLINKSRKITTISEIINLMSVDAEHLRGLVLHFLLLWACPLRVALSYFLSDTLGFSLLAGLAVLAALCPFHVVIMNRRYTLQEEEMADKDNPIKILSEVLNGIKVRTIVSNNFQVVRIKGKYTLHQKDEVTK